MTDSQFQPGQPTPPVQGGGVFGGNPEETSAVSPEQTIPSQSPEFTITHEDLIPDTTLEAEEKSPFEGYIIPQEISVDKPTEEVAAKENKEETPIVQEPVIEQPIPEETPVVEQSLPEEAQDISKPEVLSDVQQKYTTLLNNVSHLYSLLKLKEGDFIEIVGANNDTISLLYQFGVNEQKEILIKRIETQKDDDESMFNELKLALNPETHLFEIFLDEVLLFEENDLLEDHKKKSQVMEKINKFIFLTESKIKDSEKELKAKEEEEHERRRLQDIFRNF